MIAVMERPEVQPSRSHLQRRFDAITRNLREAQKENEELQAALLKYARVVALYKRELRKARGTGDGR